MRKYRFTLGLACLLLLTAGLALSDAPLMLRLLEKEGPIEQLSHAVLLIGVGVWLAARRRIETNRPFTIAVVFFLTLLLMEELDWGGEIGLPFFSEAVEALVGRRNLHNFWGGSSYLLFALPVCAWFGAPLLPARWRGLVVTRLDPYVPSRDARWALVLVATAQRSPLRGTVTPRSWSSSSSTLSSSCPRSRPSSATRRADPARTGSRARRATTTRATARPSPLRRRRGYGGSLRRRGA